MRRSVVPGCVAFVAACAGVPSAEPPASPPAPHHASAEPAAKGAAFRTDFAGAFDAALTTDRGDTAGPHVVALLDEVAAPLAAACQTGTLEAATRTAAVHLFAKARDRRGDACFAAVLADFDPEHPDRDDALGPACRAVAEMRLGGSSGALFDVFTKLRLSRLARAPNLYRDVHDATLAVADPAWEPRLVALLQRPIDNRANVGSLRDEVFWQTTSAEILGRLGTATAVRPLIKVVLSPMKVEMAATALSALVQVGKSTLPSAVALLEGTDNNLAEYSKAENLKAAAGGDDTAARAAAESAESARVKAAAIVLATLGRPEATGPMLAVLRSTKDALSRAVIARELPKLPPTPDVLNAFESAYEQTPVALAIAPGAGARESAAEASGMFFDATLVPWLVKTALATKGDERDVVPIVEASLVSAMKLMTASQIKVVDRLFDAKRMGTDGKWRATGKGFASEYEVAKALLSACGADVNCYLAKMQPTSPASSFEAIKAAYMVGVLGDPSVRERLVAALPHLESPAVRFVALAVLDHLSPAGDNAIADRLGKLIEEAEASKDASRIAGNGNLRMVMYRLRARAQ